MSWYDDCASMLKAQRADRLRRKSERLYSKSLDIHERSDKIWMKARDLGAFDKEIIG